MIDDEGKTERDFKRRLAAEEGPAVFPEAFTREGKMSDDWPKGAVAMTQSLDLLTEEPLELAVALQKLTQKRVKEAEGDDEEWGKFHEAMDRLVEALEGLNQPGGAGAGKSE